MYIDTSNWSAESVKIKWYINRVILFNKEEKNRSTNGTLVGGRLNRAAYVFLCSSSSEAPNKVDKFSRGEFQSTRGRRETSDNLVARELPLCFYLSSSDLIYLYFPRFRYRQSLGKVLASRVVGQADFSLSLPLLSFAHLRPVAYLSSSRNNLNPPVESFSSWVYHFITWLGCIGFRTVRW